MDKWDRIIHEKNILVGLHSRRNIDAIREMADLLADEPTIEDPKSFLANLIKREKQTTTGIGKGVAVPHTHEDSIDRPILAVGISREGLDFNAIDGQPVHIVALLATPKKHHKKHMELRAALSRLLQHKEVRQELVEAADAAAVRKIFTDQKN